MKRNYLVGDECWIKVTGREGLQKGSVQGWFQLDTQLPIFFIIQLDDPDHPFIENRDWTLISPTADGPLPFDGDTTYNAAPPRAARKQDA